MANEQPANRLIIRPNAETLAALLFEGLDPQGVLELKQHIISDFTNKHLKGLIDTQVVHAAILRIEAAMDNYIKREIGIVKTDWQGKVTDVALAPDLERHVQEYMSIRARNQVEAVLRTWDEPPFEATIRRMVEEEMQKITAKTVKKLVADRMNEIITKINEEKP